MTETTNVVINDDSNDLGSRFFDLEAYLNSIKFMPNIYTVAIFDCCRVPMPNLRGVPRPQSEVNTSDGQLLIVFGCMPRSAVMAYSTIV